MLLITLALLSYSIILVVIASILSLYCHSIGYTSDNFERGVYPISFPRLKYRFNYWLICIHFPVSEQELILSVPALVIILLLVDDAEFSSSFLAAYSLTMINILSYLERSGSSFWRIACALTLISNLKLWIVIIAITVLIHYLVQFSFFPTNQRFNKSFSFTFYNSNSVSFSINISVFMPFTYQVLLLRSILFVAQ